MLKSLTDKGHQLTDISRAGLNSFIRTRNGINKVMTKSRSKLPRQLSDIDFNKQDFLQYTITNEKKLFLRYDNKNNRKRYLYLKLKFNI